MVKIKFVCQGANSVIGAFAFGDIAVVSEVFARHLVQEARVADYVESAKPDQPRKPRTVKKNGPA